MLAELVDTGVFPDVWENWVFSILSHGSRATQQAKRQNRKVSPAHDFYANAILFRLLFSFRRHQELPRLIYIRSLLSPISYSPQTCTLLEQLWVLESNANPTRQLGISGPILREKKWRTQIFLHVEALGSIELFFNVLWGQAILPQTFSCCWIHFCLCEECSIWG